MRGCCAGEEHDAIHDRPRRRIRGPSGRLIGLPLSWGMPESKRLPAREECVVRELLIRRAAEHPDRDFVLFDDGERWTYSDALREVRRCAAGLDALGVRAGDFVLSWQANGPTAVKTFLALNFLGAVYVPINTSYRGQLLEHVVANSGARLLIADGRLVDRLAAIDRASLEA